jgi:hypothetical protein
MFRMAASKRSVTGGVDTHKATHHAAALDQTGRLLGDAEFPATTAGYAALLAWLRGFGRVDKVGVEGTGSYGAGLARYLTAHKAVLAANLRETAEMQDGGHLHVDHVPGHPYLAPGSISLVVNSPHGGMPGQ